MNLCFAENPAVLEGEAEGSSRECQGHEIPARLRVKVSNISGDNLKYKTHAFADIILLC